METYRDLYITLNGAEILDFIKAIENRAENSLWRRKVDTEKNLTNERTFSFYRQSDEHLPSAGLSFFTKNDEKETWYVPNVVPLEYGFLSHQQYNDLLKEFYDLVVAPATMGQGFQAKITTGHVTDSDLLGESGAKFLKSFSGCANKSTGRGHPCDADRWFAFISSVCPNDRIDVDLLQQLLQEQGWAKDTAYELSGDFEYANSLLKYMGK